MILRNYGFVICVASLSLVAAAFAAPKPQGTAELPKQAGDILSQRCLSCHNAEKKAGGIDLSTRASALSTKALIPQDVGSSRLYQQVSRGKMPPTGKMPDAEIGLLKRWIESGADYARETLEAHAPPSKPLWSLQPIRRPAVPKTKYEARAVNVIDRFLLAEIEKRGLKPSPPASKRDLLRRVTVDLTGLPPTPQEISAFLSDKSPKAYEKVVDRLLASPAYGERQARFWLDVVRYGESHGYEQNHIRPNAWPYRDYVIRAFNQDIPYTQFITEQLAGDLVGKGKADVEVATGFLVAGIHDTVGIQEEVGTRQQRINDLEDMVTTTGMTFLGLTVGCAKCHDHKFDPIPARDFYRMASVFSGVRHAERPITPKPLPPDKQKELDSARERIERLEEQIERIDTETRARLAGIKNEGKPLRPAVSPRRNTDEFAPVRAKFVRFTVLETSDGGQPCLDELQIFGPEGEANLALEKSGAKASASSLLPGYAIHQVEHLNDGMFGNRRSWISNEPGKGWVQIELPGVMQISRVIWGRDASEMLTDRLAVAYRIEVSEEGQQWKTVATGEDRAPDPTKISLDRVLAALSKEEKQKRDALSEQLEEAEAQMSALAPLKSAYIGQFTSPDPIYVLKRGDVMQRGEQVRPGALSCVAALPSELLPNTAALSAPRLTALPGQPAPETPATEGTARLALAKWIGSEKNPLTARVIVNRLWLQRFGRGLVGTPSDFGNNGERPSHPALLDWLASDFMAHGWKMKRLNKMLVLSNAYRQSAVALPENIKKDADNRFFWRMPLRRLEAEAIRDSILATSGKLNRQMGGPSYRLYNYEIVNVALYRPEEQQGPETWRRGIYQQPARGIRDSLLGSFDCPDSSERAAKRSSTTTALQALSLLNGQFVNAQAEYFAARVQKEAGIQKSAQVKRAFLLAFGRSPSLDEVKSAMGVVEKYRLETLCRALLNANEFLYY